MRIQRQAAAAVIFMAGAGLVGCQTPLGGLAFWNAKPDRAVAYTAPDVNQQKYDGLSKEFASSGRAMGQPSKTATAMGGQPPPKPNAIAAAWHKTTASVAGAFSGKPKEESLPDATRLDSPSKKVGPEVYVAAARVMENQSRFPEAQQQYERALQKAPNDLNALVGIARLHDRQGQGAKALEIYQRALKAHPKSALVHNDLGLCYARQHQLDPSIQSLTKAVGLQPENPRYRNNLATVLVEAGRTDEALQHLALTSSEAVAHYNVGFLLHKRGQQGEATQHLQHAIALDPALTPAREMLAQWGATPGASVADEGAPRIAAQPTYEAGSPYRTGFTSQPVSAASSTTSAVGGGQFRISDEGTAPSGAAASISDGPASRLPPVEE